MKTFDYKQIEASTPGGVGKMMTEIRKLGKEGWELVSVCPTSSSEFGIEIVTAFLKKENAFLQTAPHQSCYAER